MSQEKSWFEMLKERRRQLDDAVWIPLRAARTLHSVGKWGHEGHLQEFYGVGTVAVPEDRRAEAAKLGWTDVGISHDHGPSIEAGQYWSADQFRGRDGSVLGTHLVMQVTASGPEPVEWIVHPDLLLGFQLLREGDVWISPRDGYEKVLELTRSPDGTPAQLSIRAEYLKDFLCARSMALYVTSFRRRCEIVDEFGFPTWKDSEGCETGEGLKWEARVIEIHEGGMPFGERTAVFHVAHKDFDSEVDVPVLPHPTEGDFDSDSWQVRDEGKKLHAIWGKLWREEWIEPADSSPRVRGDSPTDQASFLVDGAGTRRNADLLRDEGRWLWFRPEVIPVLAHRRGGDLEWFTRDTGGVSCVPGSIVHFGINRLGLVNVYAKDLSYQPDWQQRLWAGWNVSPDGGVSEELQEAQVRARPAATQAPEAFLVPGIERLRDISVTEFGVSFVRDHDQSLEIARRTHRFRAIDRPGLFALTKDLARLTADLLDAGPMNDILGLKGEDRVRSLKALERVVALKTGDETARSLVAPLFGIYQLRLGDAHLPSKGLEEALSLAAVPADVPLLFQGYHVVRSCVDTIWRVSEALGSESPKPTGDTGQ